MSEVKIQTELRDKEDRLIKRYSLWSKLILLISIVLIVWILVVFMGILFWESGPNWAVISLDLWLIVLSVIFALFIILELVFYMHYNSVRDKRIILETPKPEYIDGKLVVIFTHPAGIEGGIFSKTYINIDKKSVLRLRTLLIPPEDLWKK